MSGEEESPSSGRGVSTAGRKVKLLVLYGGRSAEHDVSCVSAFHVVNAVDPDRYDLRLVGITTKGEWVDADKSLTEGRAPGHPEALPSPDALSSTGDGSGRALLPADAVNPASSSEVTCPLVVLPLIHGPMGEDGTLQGLLELAGVPYCGAGVAGSAAAMDKGLTKALLAAAGLPQARYLSMRETGLATSDLTRRIDRDLGWPVFVKPANMGSSIGISKVDNAEGLRAAIEQARSFDEFLIVEEAVAGREIEIGVLGWPDLRASVPGEVRPSHEFYDYEDKYVDGTAGLVVPAQLPDGVADQVGRFAIAACQALRVDCMARVDFFFDEGGRGLVINEVNTIPGFTPISMYPRMWAASGVSYSQLVDELTGQALRRSERRSRFQTRRR